jgi:hypothetical protein
MNEPSLQNSDSNRANISNSFRPVLILGDSNGHTGNLVKL